MTIENDIKRDREITRLAKEAKLPAYMWDTASGFDALLRLVDLVRREYVSREDVLEEAAQHLDKMYPNNGAPALYVRTLKQYEHDISQRSEKP